MQRAGIRKTPPPTPSKPDTIPIEKPTIAAFNKLKSISAFSPSALEPNSISNATIKSRHAKIICKILEGTTFARRPPQNPPIIPKIANLIPGLIIMGEWKDFLKAFSVGIKPYSLLELKNIIGAVDAAQKLTIYGALFAIIISGVLLMGRLDTPSTIGPNLAVCFLAGFYAVIIEFLLLPLRLNAERKMNEEMDLGE